MRRIALAVLAALAGCDRAEKLAVSPADPKPQSRNESKAEAKAIATTTAAATAQLPVAAVTLYASGVAYIERKGTVLGDAAIDLQFKAGELPAILKSLLVDDPTSPMQATVRPETPDANGQPRVDLAGNPSRADLLKQLRGARVKVQTGDENREMTILSVEEMPRPEKLDKSGKPDKNGEFFLPSWQVNAFNGTTLQHIPFDQIKRMEVVDANVQQDLQKALDALWQKDKDKDKRTVTIQLRGQGERPVRVAYTAEAQPWKISYRLAMSDKPTLQAWASVANATDADWNNVRLHLMGGRPLVLAQDGSVDSAAIKRASRDGSGIPAGESFRRPRPIPSRESLDGEPQAPILRDETARTPDGPVISAGEGFRYPVPSATIPKQSTAMVPILNGDIAVEPVAVYNETLLKRNAFQGARVRNTSKQYLLAGTVTVLDEGGYVGDASLENLAPGRFGIVTWGIDLPLLVDSTEITHSSTIADAAIESGVLQLNRKHIYTRQYIAENEDQKDRVLIIEHPIRRGWQLIEPAQPMEATETVYRFRENLPSATRSKLLVKEQITEADGIDLALADLETVLALSRTPEIPETVRTALAKVVTTKQALADQQRQADRRQVQINDLVAEQARMRKNIEAATDDEGLRSRWLKKVEETEKEIQKLRQETAASADKHEVARKDAEASIRQITAARPTKQAAADGK